MSKKRTQFGFSLIELMVVIGIMTLVFIGLAVLLRTGFYLSQATFRQGLTTEDARVQLKRMSSEIRNAQVGSGDWLLIANDNELKIKGDVDADEDFEDVRYALSSDDLVRGVTNSGGVEATRVVARSFKNSASNEPLFQYYDTQGQVLAEGERTSAAVRRIGISLHVDVEGGGISEVSTVVVLRKGNVTSDDLSSDAYLNPVTLVVSGSPPTSDQVKVIRYDSDGGSTTRWLRVTTLNNGYLTTYHDGYDVNLNYQAIDTSDGYLEGWYTWVGPIALGSGSKTDQISISGLYSSQCLGNQTLESTLSSCSDRTVSFGSYSETYAPVYTYEDPDTGDLYYVRDIFTNQDWTEPVCPQGITTDLSGGNNLKQRASACVTFCNPNTPTTTDSCALFLDYNAGGDYVCECFGYGPEAPIVPEPNTQISPDDLNPTYNSCNASCGDSYLTCGLSGNRTNDWCSCSCDNTECGDGICNAYRDETSTSCPVDCSS